MSAADAPSRPGSSGPGRDGPGPGRHQERLWVPWSWCLVAAACVASVAVVCFFYTPPWVVLVVTVLALAAAVALLLDQSVPITVDRSGLRAGRSRIEWEWVAGARALSPAETEHRTRGRADVTAFRLTRPYLPRQVRVELDDPADPHPAWLLGSRRPDALAAAIQAQLVAHRRGSRR